MVVEDLLLDTPADDVKVDLELVVIDAALVGDHDLLDLRPARVRFLSDHRRIDRHLAPALNAVAEAENLRLDDAPAKILRAEIGLGQEHHADGESPALGALAGCLHMLPEEVLRNLDMNAGAVAGHPVRIDRAPVPHRLQRCDAGLDHIAPRRAVERGDEADPARVVLESGVVEAAAQAHRLCEGRVLANAHAAASLTTEPSCAAFWI